MRGFLFLVEPKNHFLGQKHQPLFFYLGRDCNIIINPIKPKRTPLIPESVGSKRSTIHRSIVVVARFIIGISIEGPPSNQAIGGYIRREILGRSAANNGKQGKEREKKFFHGFIFCLYNRLILFYVVQFELFDANIMVFGIRPLGQKIFCPYKHGFGLILK